MCMDMMREICLSWINKNKAQVETKSNRWTFSQSDLPEHSKIFPHHNFRIQDRCTSPTDPVHGRDVYRARHGARKHRDHHASCQRWFQNEWFLHRSKSFWQQYNFSKKRLQLQIQPSLAKLSTKYPRSTILTNKNRPIPQTIRFLLNEAVPLCIFDVKHRRR